MGIIQRLDENTISQIAAGEIIESPFGVIRELLDNSIDAFADHIVVELVDGGLSYIEVVDNGKGMSKEDLLLAIRAHTTSKIKTFDDIYQLSTFGFRGEALSTITQVAKVKLTSKTKEDDFAHLLTVDFGKIDKTKNVSFSNGTRISVENLFDKLPVRKKFLSTSASEMYKIDKELSKKALAYPNIHFELFHNNKQKNNYVIRTSLLSRIYDVFPEMIDKLTPFDIENEGIHLHGFFGSPQFLQKTRRLEYFFVNKKAVTWKAFSPMIMRLYDNKIPKGYFPVFFCFVEISPSIVDFNVHPTKEMIRFQDERNMLKLIEHTLKKAMFGAQEDFFIKEKANFDIQYVKPSFSNPNIVRSIPVEEFNFSQKSAQKSTPSFFKAELNPQITESETFHTFEKNDISKVDNNKVENKKDEHGDDLLKDYIFVGVLFDTYIILQSKDKVLFLDFHAAHERLNYEKIKNQYEHSSEDVQLLLVPLQLEVPFEIVEILKENLTTLHLMGFDVEYFGGSTFVVNSVLSYLQNKNIKEMIIECGYAFLQNPEQKNIQFLDQSIKQMACKASIKAGYQITLEEVDSLLGKLKDLGYPSTCPHGRPLLFFIEKKDFEKQIRRSGFSSFG